MHERDLFPDYEPKRTPDTLQDYLRKESFVYRVLSEVGDPILNNLNIILVNFNNYKKDAIKNPGELRKGNVAIGADPDQYYPSEEELLVSELGKRVKIIVENTQKEALNRYKKDNKIRTKQISFYEIYFRHVDVMGSGRFYYAEKKPKKILLNL